MMTSSVEMSRLEAASASSHRFAWLVVFRLCNALLVRTYFSADEYWQGPEVAHHMVWGRGHKTWEWQEPAQIRSYLHPLLYALPFKLQQLLGCDTWWAVDSVPKTVHGMMAAVQDWCVHRLALRWFGPLAAQFALLMSMTNWFSLYAGTRALSNNIEATAGVSAMCLLFVLNSGSKASHNQALAWALLTCACAIRPTTVLWLVGLAGAFALQQKHLHKTSVLIEAARTCVASCLVTMCAAVCVDSWVYGAWTVPAKNFAAMNARLDIGRMYGVHPWHWYFSCGVWAVVGTHIVPVAAGLLLLPHTAVRGLCAAGLVYVSALSAVSHKEDRFLLPVLPLAALCGGAGLQVMRVRMSDRSFRCCLLALVMPNLVAAAFLCFWHQTGAILATEHLAHIAQTSSVRAEFWMPCHSTPYYSVVHSDTASLDFITCTLWDRLQAGRGSGLITPSDAFQSDPVGFLTRRRQTMSNQTHVFMFRAHSMVAQSVLEEWQLRKIKSFPDLPTWLAQHEHLFVDQIVDVYQHADFPLVPPLQRWWGALAFIAFMILSACVLLRTTGTCETFQCKEQ